ncbi:MAG: hypothetical protein JNK57_11420 [Planctomycetaceae bacterium]|nr:hypothetical protein [Planctomycetaceae bacterium]
MPEKSQAIETHFACCEHKCSIRISPSSDQGSQRIEGVIVLADPPHLSSHQRTPSPPPLSWSYRDPRLKTSNLCNHRNQQYSMISLTNAAGTLVERYSYTAYGTLERRGTPLVLKNANCTAFLEND